MNTPEVKPEWRSSTVLELCRSMREAQDWSAMPILADALQDADCDDDQLLKDLRGGPHPYARAAGLVACVLSDAARDAVGWLAEFANHSGSPRYDALIAAATGSHHENGDEGEGGYFHSENDGEYLHFGGRDAHGAIPPEFWDKVQVATGVSIPGHARATSFSCSC